MSAPSDRDAVAILGAGVAGLTAARLLARAGAAVHVFDKGNGVGGRTTIRRTDGGPQFDHGAQYFTAESDRFRAQVAEWVADGVAAEWAATLSVIEMGAAGAKRAEPPAAKKRYVGVPGMNAPAKRLAQEVAEAGGRVTTGVRVAPLKRGDGRWRLASEAGEPLGDFAKVLVTAPAPQAAELLTPSPALSNAAKSVRMTGCWAAMVAFDERLALDFDGAFVNGSPESTPLSWIARDGSKPGRPEHLGEAWVLHGSPEWSEANIDVAPDEAARQLLAGLEAASGAKPPAPAFSTAHRWRYALPETPLQDTVLADRGLDLYAAGDWCGGPKVEGAFLSGLAAGEAVLGR